MKRRPNQSPKPKMPESSLLRGLRLGRAAFWGEKGLIDVNEAPQTFSLKATVQKNVQKLAEIQPAAENSTAAKYITELKDQLATQADTADVQSVVSVRLPLQEWIEFGEVAAILTRHRITGRASLFQYLHQPDVAELLGADGLITHRKADGLLKIQLSSPNATESANPTTLQTLEASVATSINAPVLASQETTEGDRYHVILPFGEQSAVTLSLRQTAGGIGQVMVPYEVAFTVANPFTPTA